LRCAQSQQRTFVSGLGNDANPCSRTAPCRTFTQALSLTNAGGEVVVVDSAGYGAFAIAQSVTVQAPPGVYAGISVFSGDGITINAGATDAIILRGLTVNNQGSPGSGIRLITGGTLHVESCVVNGFPSATGGVSFAGGGRAELKDSIIRGNNHGVLVEGSVTASIDHVRLEGNADGLLAEDGSKVTISNSVASNNSAGLRAISFGAEVVLNIESCLVANNTSNGIMSQSVSGGIVTVRVSNSTVTDNNAAGLVTIGSPAQLLSRGNNTVEGNTINTNGTIGSYTAK
jgi:nitrous oxidase accessory protein NosD